MKKITIKYNLMLSYYYLYVIELLILIMLPVVTSYFTEYVDSLKWFLLAVGILAVVFPIMSVLIVYLLKKETVEFTEEKITIIKKDGTLELPLDKLSKLSYTPNVWYKLPFMEYYDGGMFEITHKNGKVYNLKVFKTTYKKLVKELKYQIEEQNKKIDMKKSFRD